MDQKKITPFIKQVLDYYERDGRHHLPWRKTHDPYAILVSEIMLQQTQVDRVTPYFERWMRTFPTVHSLAEAPLSVVLREWSGLGYNRRAKLLRECAKEIVEKYAGRVPKDRGALVALPGIGPYTAGAIRAFAFNEPGVFLETNIRAALIHYFFPKVVKVDDAELYPVAALLLVDAPRPREWYSALMDYGTHIKKMHQNPSRRSRHHTKQSRFEGSLREARGAIIKALLAKKTVSHLPRTARYATALAALAAEGVIRKKGSGWRIR